MEPFHPIYEYLIINRVFCVKENHQEISKYFGDHWMEPFHPIYEYLITHSNSIVKENHKEISKYFGDH